MDEELQTDASSEAPGVTVARLASKWGLGWPFPFDPVVQVISPVVGHWISHFFLGYNS